MKINEGESKDWHYWVLDEKGLIINQGTKERMIDYCKASGKEYEVVDMNDPELKTVWPEICPIHDFEAPCPSCAIVKLSVG